MSRMRWREGPESAASSTNIVWERGSVGGGDRPAEAGQLARDGDRDDGAALAPLCVEALPGAMQPSLGLPGDRAGLLGLTGLTTLKLAPTRGPASIVPGRLDEQAAGVL